MHLERPKSPANANSASYAQAHGSTRRDSASFADIVEGFTRTVSLNDEVRDAIVSYMRAKLEYDLGNMGLGLELLELTSPGMLAGKPHSLPLKIDLKGPSDVSNFALDYIMEAVRDAEQEILNNIKKMDGTAFNDVKVSFESYDFDDILTGEGAISTATTKPTRYPTPAPVLVIEPKNVGVLVVEETKSIAWWVWLIIGLVILCCIIGCCCYCIQRRSRHTKPRSSNKSVASSSKRVRRKSEHPRRSDQSRRTIQSKRSQQTQRTHRTRSSRRAPTSRDIKPLPPLALT